MSVALFDGVTLTVEAALSAAVGGCGAWGSGSDSDPSLWDSALWGPDETYVDITQYVRRWSTKRGFSRDVQAWEAGSGQIIASNLDGRFCADNLSGPYVTAGLTGVRPWRPARIKAAYAGVTYPIARMYAKDFIESYPFLGPVGCGDAIVTIPLADEWARLSSAKGSAVGAVGAGELYGERVHRILDAAGHTGERVVDEGTVTMQATTLASSRAAELRLTADSEGGAIWVDESGAVVAARQYGLVEDTRSITSQASFGDDIAGGEVPYSDISLGSAGDLILSRVSWARTGGVEQVAYDPVSAALYGERDDPRSDLICETDDQVAALVAWRLARYKAPERRVESITIKPRRDPALMFPLALGLRVRDLITVKRRPPGGHTITQYCHIAGISHQVSAKPRQWTTTLHLWSATPYQAFARSLWDTGTWAASDTDGSAAVWFY